jgi:hypothetical protein
MSYKMITTAERGWFFVQRDQAQIKKHNLPGPIIHRIAAWALTEDGKVVGLLGVGLYDGSGSPDGSQTYLHEPNPKVNGEYVHFNDLTQAELSYLGSDPSRPNKGSI